MTKAQQILELYALHAGFVPEHRLPRMVAEEVGTTDSYVRTVARQRKGRGLCEAEIRYNQSPLGKARFRRADAARWQKIKADPVALRAHYDANNLYRKKRRETA